MERLFIGFVSVNVELFERYVNRTCTMAEANHVAVIKEIFGAKILLISVLDD
jgi:hypothetical protein